MVPVYLDIFLQTGGDPPPVSNKPAASPSAAHVLFILFHSGQIPSLLGRRTSRRVSRREIPWVTTTRFTSSSARREKRSTSSTTPSCRGSPGCVRWVTATNPLRRLKTRGTLLVSEQIATSKPHVTPLWVRLAILMCFQPIWFKLAFLLPPLPFPRNVIFPSASISLTMSAALVRPTSSSPSSSSPLSSAGFISIQGCFAAKWNTFPPCFTAFFPLFFFCIQTEDVTDHLNYWSRSSFSVL